VIAGNQRYAARISLIDLIRSRWRVLLFHDRRITLPGEGVGLRLISTIAARHPVPALGGLVRHGPRCRDPATTPDPRHERCSASNRRRTNSEILLVSARHPKHSRLPHLCWGRRFEESRDPRLRCAQPTALSMV